VARAGTGKHLPGRPDVLGWHTRLDLVHLLMSGYPASRDVDPSIGGFPIGTEDLCACIEFPVMPQASCYAISQGAPETRVLKRGQPHGRYSM